MTVDGPDFLFTNEGSFVLIKPISDAGKQWADANLADVTRLKGATVCEPRYVGQIEDGLTAQWGPDSAGFSSGAVN